MRGEGIYCVSYRVIQERRVGSIGHREREVPTKMRMAAEIDLLESTGTEAL